MLKKPSSCKGCLLEVKGSGFAYPVGSGKNQVMLIGEALGEDEAHRGEPFVGGSGRLLNQALQRAGLLREDFVITNTINCRPPNNELLYQPYQWGAIKFCSQYLYKYLQDYDPKVVVTIGAIATEALLQQRVEVTKIRGYCYDCSTPNWSGLLIPTYHPSWLMQRGKFNLLGVMAHDLSRAQKFASSGETKYNPYYLIDPSINSASWWAQEAISKGKVLAADIETIYSADLDEETYDTLEDVEIERISFAFEKGNAISMPWNEEFLPLIKRLLEHKWEEGLVFWNADFDLPRLRAKGIKDTSRIVDAMWMWHFLQSDLPKGLGFVSTFFTPLREWKSLVSTNFSLYSAMDSDATIWNYEEIKNKLQKEHRWERFERDVIELDPLVKKMGQSGVLVDLEQRAKIREVVASALASVQPELNDKVPDEMKPIIERATLQRETLCSRCSGSGKEPSKTALKKRKLTLKDLPLNWRDGGYYEIYWGEDCGRCRDCEGKGSLIKQRKVKEEGEVIDNWRGVKGKWQKRDSFNALSSKQVINYIDANGHTVPKNHLTEESTSGEKELETLIRRYPTNEVYPLILKVRGLSKIQSQYIEGYRPSSDHRQRTEFGYQPSTWRFSSRRPNIQNIPNPKRCTDNEERQIATEIRNCYVASPGCTLVGVDFAAIEAVLAGWYAKDYEYIKACKLGIHGILASYQMVLTGDRTEPISLSWSDERIKEEVKKIKKDYPLIYAKAKPVTHGSTFGGTAFRLKMENPTAFRTVKEAKDLQEILFREIGTKLHLWQWETIYEAFRQGYLDNAFQYRHWFWKALSYSAAVKPKGFVSVEELMETVLEKVSNGYIGQDAYVEIKGGAYNVEWSKDAKRILGFKPQSTAAAIMRRSMRKLEPKFGPLMRWTIHDELIFEIPDDSLEDSIGEIVEIMSSPIEELDGLTIDVEVARGKKWGDLS